MLELVNIVAWPAVTVFLIFVAKAIYSDFRKDHNAIYAAIETINGFEKAKARIEVLEKEVGETQMKLNAMMLKSGLSFN